MATVSIDPAALAALATWHRALVPLGELPGLLGLDEDDALDVVAELEDAGLVQTWDDPDDDAEPLVILSPLGAERVGVELRADPASYRWVPLGSPRRCPVARGDAPVTAETDMSDPARGGLGSFLDSLPDRRALDPALVAEALDALPPPVPRKGSRTPRETFAGVPPTIYGLDCLWPVVVTPDGRCEGCGGRWARGHALCLCCNRANAIDAPGTPPIPDRLGPRKVAPPPLELAKVLESRAPALDGKRAKASRGFSFARSRVRG